MLDFEKVRYEALSSIRMAIRAKGLDSFEPIASILADAIMKAIQEYDRQKSE